MGKSDGYDEVVWNIVKLQNFLSNIILNFTRVKR